MEKSYIHALSMLGTAEELDPGMVADIERFVCQLYNKQVITSVNDARYAHFVDSFKPKKDTEPLRAFKGVDASLSHHANQF